MKLRGESVYIPNSSGASGGNRTGYYRNVAVVGVEEAERLRKLILDVVKEMERAFPDGEHCQECGINQTEAWGALEEEAKR